jgi:hypothetical protein
VNRLGLVHYTCEHHIPVPARGDQHLAQLCPICAARVPAIARLFADDYRANVTPQQFAETRYRNSLPTYARACATHDFLDANECMAFAFETIVGRAARPSSDGDCALWNAAWDLAKPEYLTAAPDEAAAWKAAQP